MESLLRSSSESICESSTVTISGYINNAAKVFIRFSVNSRCNTCSHLKADTLIFKVQIPLNNFPDIRGEENIKNEALGILRDRLDKGAVMTTCYKCYKEYPVTCSGKQVN